MKLPQLYFLKLTVLSLNHLIYEEQPSTHRTMTFQCLQRLGLELFAGYAINKLWGGRAGGGAGRAVLFRLDVGQYLFNSLRDDEPGGDRGALNCT